MQKWQATKVAVKTTKENASNQFHKELNLMMYAMKDIDLFFVHC